MINLTIGFDPREAVAYHVCSQSIISRSSEPLAITPLALKNLKGYHESHKDGSNAFIYTRFLTPHLMNYQGWCIFVDGDMVVLDDIAKLWAQRDDRYAVMVVKHDYQTNAPMKYLGNINENYPRQNWSSVILWNCGHPDNKVLTPGYVETATGAQLHRFQHLKDEEMMGASAGPWARRHAACFCGASLCRSHVVALSLLSPRQPFSRRRAPLRAP